jgi:2-phospho-L-lactate guanylyltransferase
MRTCAVLPVKRFDDAKQRLDRALNAGTRRALAEAMVSDVLHGLRRAQGVDKVIVVTGESGAEALARAYDAESIPDDDRGHSHAARAGVDWALERDYDRVLLVPGDCPALDPNEIDELVRTGMSAPDVVIVPDRHGEGTNALLLAPPDAIAPSFGPGSRARHEQAAEAAGARWRIAEPRSLVLDVDTAEDLVALRAALDARTGGAAHTRGLLARIDRRGR